MMILKMHQKGMVTYFFFQESVVYLVTRGEFDPEKSIGVVLERFENVSEMFGNSSILKKSTEGLLPKSVFE